MSDDRPIDRKGPTLQRRGWRWGIFAGAWALIGILWVGPIVVQCIAEDLAIPWSRVLSELLSWYLWGPLFPLIAWVVRRFPFERRRWKSRLAVNLLFGVLISCLYGVLALVKSQLILDGFFALARRGAGQPATGGLSFSMLSFLPSYLLSGIELFLVVYFALVAVIHAVTYSEKVRDRELRASRLETQLAHAQLEVLRTQLHPHFLFNTLNAISALMRRDVEAADRMIALLSDFLRLSLDKDDRHQVPLQTELELLERYLAIEKIRFRDRLRVEVDVPSECLHAQVPKLILQPLVENAIHHGIARRSASGRVAIRARRLGEGLALEVADDGPGLPAGGAREGVGLANTRQRLSQLYGDHHDFELGRGEGGGVEVRLRIPFEAEARFPVQGAA